MAHVELSEKNPYYISKHRYYELMKHFDEDKEIITVFTK